MNILFTGLKISDTNAVHMKRFLQSSPKGKDKEGKKVNLNKYLKVKLNKLGLNWAKLSSSWD